MSSRVTLGAKHASEIVSEVFDFTSRLAAGETISAATVTAFVYSGSDPTPAALISGPAAISGGKVTQRVTGGFMGNVYDLVCTATTSVGQVLQITGYLVVSPDTQ